MEFEPFYPFFYGSLGEPLRLRTACCGLRKRVETSENGGSLAAPLSCHAGGREFESRRPRSKKKKGLRA
jgi:hypothetical protein